VEQEGLGVLGNVGNVLKKDKTFYPRQPMVYCEILYGFCENPRGFNVIGRLKNRKIFSN